MLFIFTVYLDARVGESHGKVEVCISCSLHKNIEICCSKHCSGARFFLSNEENQRLVQAAGKHYPPYPQVEHDRTQKGYPNISIQKEEGEAHSW